MRVPPSDPPAGGPGSDDPFAEFPSESTTADRPIEKHDWLAEFPDEKKTPPVLRAKTWTQLSKSVTDENGQS